MSQQEQYQIIVSAGMWKAFDDHIDRSLAVEGASWLALSLERDNKRIKPLSGQTIYETNLGDRRYSNFYSLRLPAILAFLCSKGGFGV